MNNRFKYILLCIVCISPLLSYYLFCPTRSQEYQESKLYIQSNFTQSVRSDVSWLRKTIDKPHTIDKDKLKSVVANCITHGSTNDIENLGTLLVGCTIDWPPVLTKAYSDEFMGFSKDLLANFNDNVSISWAGLAIAAQLRRENEVKDMATSMYNNTSSEEFRELYKQCYK